MLDVLDHLPPGLLEVEPTRITDVLRGPTLIHLAGRRTEPLFVSTLLHGNETTGVTALQALLKKYRDQPLPRSLSLFIGNVEAAARGKRKLESQQDFNRIWRGGSSSEHGMAMRVLSEMRARNVFACVDVHNNTGLNPHYAIVSRIDHRFFQLATLFGRTVVYARKPDTTVDKAFSGLCPSVTLECGVPGKARGVEHVCEYLEACMNLARIPELPVPDHDMDLFHTVAIVKVPNGYSFSFGDDSAADIQFMPEMDHLNFRELAAGAVFAKIRPDSGARLEAWDENGVDAAARYFVEENGEIRTVYALMPSMLTLEKDVIRMDCLCYLMERLDWRHQLDDRGERRLA